MNGRRKTNSVNIKIEESDQETPPPQFFTPREQNQPNKRPSLENNDDDGLSYSLGSSSQASLSSQDRLKLKQIVNKLFGTQQYEDDKKNFNEMLAQAEDVVDDKPNFVEGIFYIYKYTWKQLCLCRKPKQVQKICVYDANSLYILNHKTCLRKCIVAVAESQAFETVNNLIIVLATLVMLMTDPLDPDNNTKWNQQLDYITLAIVSIFTLEMFIKVAAQGLIMHPNSYLRDPWNLIDLTVVLTGILERTPISGIQLTGMRPLRVLRTLRSIKTFPNMRKLIQGMIDSVPTLLNAVVFMGFVYLQFAIFGTQQFGGDYYQRCRYEPKPPDKGEWAYSDVKLCSKDQESGYQCPDGQTCGEWQDSLIDMQQIDYGFTNFNNIFSSLWTIFQCITLEGWTNIMYNLYDAESPNWVVPTFFICLVILGSLFLLNVVLAIFSDSLEKQEVIRQRQENQRKNLIALSVKRQQAQTGNRIQEPQNALTKNLGQILRNKVLNSIDETNITIDEPAPLEITQQPDIHQLHVFFGDPIPLIIPSRASKNWLYKHCFILCNRPIYQLFIQIMIILNFFVLATDRYPISDKEVTITDNINTSISFVFLFEMIIKLLGYGPKEYARDTFNLFEALIVCTSMVELILFYVSGAKGALTVFRAIRILRMFKLSRKWKAFTLIFNKILDSLKDIGYFLVLMAIFIIVFTILGMQFFAATVYLDADGNLTTAEKGVVPQTNFNSAYSAFVTVFTVVIGDNWNSIMYDYARYNFSLATFYFFTLTTITNIILLNLFLALLLQNFQQPLKTSGEQDLDIGGLLQLKQKLVSNLRKIIAMMFSICKCCKIDVQQEEPISSDSEETIKRKSEILQNDFYEKRLNTGNLLLVQSMQMKNKSFIRVSDLNLAETDSKKNNNLFSIASIAKSDLLSFVKAKSSVINLEGTSLFMLSRTNRFRKIIADVVCNKHFDNLTILVILVSTIILSLDSPLNDPNSSKTIVIYYMDIAITAIFALEAILKIIVYGLLFNGKESYLRSLWNIIDLLTVLISIISQVTPAGDDNMSFFKILRAIRFLRPLRIIQKNQGLKIAVHSLINALPGIFNLVIICGSLLTIFSILGVNLFKGGFSTCDMTNIPNEVQANIQTMWDCLDYGGEWVNYQYNFDNLLQAIKTQFCIMTTEGWFNIFWMTYNYSDSYYAMPLPKSSPYSIIYFIVCLFVTHLFILNMFVGVVISTFNIEKEKLNHNTHLTKLESEYIDTCVLCYQTKPVAAFAKSGSCLKDKMRLIADHKATDIIVFICIVLNSVILMLQWYNQSLTMQFTLDIINDCLSVVFTLEFIIKVIGYGLNYFKSLWNLVDFFVVVTSWIDFAMMQHSSSEGHSSIKIIRTFRVVRILKLMRRFKEMQRILNTFLQAIPALLNVGGLLFLFLYLYAVGAVYLFSHVKLQSSLNENANFQSFGLALLTLFRMSTGENWDDIMEDCARQRSLDFLCHTQTYEQQQAEGIQGCGNPTYSYLFFCSFMVFITFIMLNLFIAIILEAFERQLAEEAQAIQPETIEEFIVLWREFDPTASGFIPIDKLEELIIKLLQREQHIRKLRPNSQDVLFNLNESKLLKLYNAWKQQHDDGSSQYRDITKSVRMQRLLHRHFNRWIGGLMIPTYSKVQQYYFHDVLLALVKFFFSQKYKDAYHQRMHRIQNLVETGQELTQFDQVTVDKKLFDKMSQFDKMKFNELNSENFVDVIESIERKGQRQVKVIARLQSMLEMRRKISLKNAKILDDYKDMVINSNHVIAVKIITKFIIQKNIELQKRKEKRRQARHLNISNYKFQKLLTPNQNIRRLKQVTQKQFQQYHIQDVINHNRNIQNNFSSSGSSPSSASSMPRSSKRSSCQLTDLVQAQIEEIVSSSSSEQSVQNQIHHQQPIIIIESPHRREIPDGPDQSSKSFETQQSAQSVQNPKKTIQQLESQGLQMEIEFKDLIYELDNLSSTKYKTDVIQAKTKITKGNRTLFNLPFLKERMH